KDDLMKMIVHDLKSPLTSVLASLEMLRDGDFGELSDTQSVAVLDAEIKAHDLLDLIGDLLEIARLEDAKMHIEPREISVGDFLTELIGEWELRMRQARATAVVDVAEDTGSIEADPVLLKRVFSNLVQNSMVHSATPVSLRIAARSD